jgi:hypothetical protein
MANCESDIATLKNMIDACNIRTGLISIASVLCMDIEEFDGTTQVQSNRNVATTDYPAATATIIEIGDVTVTEIPIGSLVGDTIVAQFDGLYRINFLATNPTSGVSEIDTLEILINGVVDSVFTIQDDGVNTTTFATEINKRLTANDIISARMTSPTGITNANFDLRIDKVL